MHEVDLAGAGLLLLRESLMGFEGGEESAVCVSGLWDAGQGARR